MDTIEANCLDCDGLTDEQERVGREIAALVSDKWSTWILFELHNGGTQRFSRLMKSVEGITQKMLTKSLRNLERHGIVSRTMFMEVPPRVEYALTDLGRELIAAVAPFWNWVMETVPKFEAAREEFDAKTPASRAA